MVSVTATIGGNVVTTLVPVSLMLQRPTLSTTPSTLTLGGQTGRDLSAQTLQLSLNTGANAYAFTAGGGTTIATTSPLSGTVSSTAVPIRLAAVSGLAPGSRTASLVVTATVNGDTITKTIPVVANVDTHRLIASETGVALTKTPSWSRVTRSLTIADNFGMATPWTAASNRSWLTVTGSGTGSQSLALTANPAGLPADQLQMATITIASNDPAIPIETIQVGLWVGSTDGTRTALAGSYVQTHTDPTRPYVYAHSAGPDLVAFNVYTGQEVYRLANVAGQLGGMDVSNDGRTLFVIDVSTQKIVAIDLEARTRSLDWPIATQSRLPTHLRYARPNGVGVVLANSGSAFAAADGTRLRSDIVDTFYSYALDVARDGTKFIASAEGISPTTYEQHTLDYSDAASPGLLLGPNTGRTAHSIAYSPANAFDVAYSADGSIIYSASGFPYLIPGYSATDFTLLRSLAAQAYPMAVEVGSDGRVFLVTGTTFSGPDFWVYAADGSAITDRAIRNIGLNGTQYTYAGGILSVSGDGLVAVVIAPKAGTSIELVPIGP